MSTSKWPLAHERLWLFGAGLAVIVLTVLAYLPALHGPYLLDDTGNLEPVKRWLDGSLSFGGTVLGNRSGPTGRPLSMVTFVFDAWRAGNMNSFAFKETNLVIHILTGVLVFILVDQLLAATHQSTANRKWIALTVATIWLWFPINVSTVSYVVQRMAQLSAMWMIATAAAYVALRRSLATQSTIRIQIGLWIGIPVLAAAAALSKENGVLALPLAAIIEWAAFGDARRPRSLILFFMMTVAIPGVIVLSYLAIHPSYFLSGYQARDFTITQRLLTEPRILWAYLSTTFFPVGPAMGIFHDNYPVSRSLWQPASTALAVGAWAALLICAIAWRRRAPLFALGVVAFIAAHSIESGPIALELYFEHRNYLPSVFAVIACLGLILEFGQFSESTIAFRRASLGALALMLAAYGFGTWNQASTWADADQLYAIQAEYNPTSPRLLSVLTARAMLSKDLPGALMYIDAAERNEPASERGTESLWRIMAYCQTETSPSIPASLYEELETNSKGRVTAYAMTAWELLANRVHEGCPGLDAGRVARAGATWLNQAPQDPGDQAIWRTRYNVGRIFAFSGHVDEAEVATRISWRDSKRNNGIGVLLFQLSAAQGKTAQCEEILAALEASYSAGDRNLDASIRTLRREMGELRGSRTQDASK